MSDDEIIGLKSTSLKFRKNIRLFVSICYFIFLTLITYLFHNYFGSNIFTFFLMLFIISLLYQLIKLKRDKSENYLKLFKLNNYTGFFLFLSIISTNL